MIDSYLAGLVLTALLLFVGHWYDWPTGKLARLWAYVWGVGCILVGQLVWLAATPTVQTAGWRLWLQIASFAAVGGAATGISYLIDWVQALWVARHISERRPDKRS